MEGRQRLAFQNERYVRLGQLDVGMLLD